MTSASPRPSDFERRSCAQTTSPLAEEPRDDSRWELTGLGWPAPEARRLWSYRRDALNASSSLLGFSTLFCLAPPVFASECRPEDRSDPVAGAPCSMAGFGCLRLVRNRKVGDTKAPNTTPTAKIVVRRIHVRNRFKGVSRAEKAGMERRRWPNLDGCRDPRRRTLPPRPVSGQTMHGRRADPGLAGPAAGRSAYSNSSVWAVGLRRVMLRK
jgi:hypothetical protein